MDRGFYIALWDPPKKVFSAFVNSSRHGEPIVVSSFVFGEETKILGKNFSRKVEAMTPPPTPPLLFLRLSLVQEQSVGKIVRVGWSELDLGGRRGRWVMLGLSRMSDLQSAVFAWCH